MAKGQPRNTGRIVSEAEFRRMWGDLTITVAQIGERLGISQQAVTARAIGRGLPQRPKRGGEPACDPVALTRLYVAGVRKVEIARVFGCSRRTIHNYLVRLSLPRRCDKSSPTISLADYAADRLRDRLAISAKAEMAALRNAEMVDRQPGRPAA